MASKKDIENAWNNANIIRGKILMYIERINMEMKFINLHTEKQAIWDGK